MDSCAGTRLGEQVAERLADAVDALDFVLKVRHNRADVGERVADVLHVPFLRRDAVENELVGLVCDQRPVNQAVDDDAADRMPKSLEKR